MTEPFRYCDEDHSYWLGDTRIRGVSELIDLGGYTKARPFYTADGRQRGSDVHAICMEIDMGALVPAAITNGHRAYGLGYGELLKRLKPTWDLGIELALCHRGYRFGGRPDRVGTALGRRTIAEIKSGARNNERDGLQLALQAILAEESFGLPARMWQRLGLYPKSSGKFEAFEFDDARDFEKAYALIKEHC